MRPTRHRLRILFYGLVFVGGSVLCFLALGLLGVVAVLVDGGLRGRQVVECGYAECAPLAEFADDHGRSLLVADSLVAVAACAAVFAFAFRRA